MKTRKKEKQTKPPKMILAQHYAAGAPSFKSFVKDARFSIPCLLVAIVLSYVLCLNLIGNGANGYIDQMYENLTETVKSSLLNKETLQIEEADMEGFRPTYDATLLQQNVDKYSVEYENGQNKMVCVKENGFFKAKITVILTDEFFLVGEPTRNFVSAESYNTYFWIVFGVSIFGAALLIWIVSEAVFYGMLRLAIASSYKKHGSTLQVAAPLTDVSAGQSSAEQDQEAMQQASA
ncbi:MAG: hypothetical protein HFJ28_04945 [Clostridia bacterium]|jgi:hypothetical protein|nr:hypothetical protein [Clostridia bacterium]